MCKVLIIDDEDEVRASVERRLKRDGIRTETADGEADGISKIDSAEPPYDLILTDMSMETPESGMKVIQAAVARDIFSEVIVLTAYGNVANAVECMKRGAFDYVEKNIPGVDVYDLISLKVAQALDHRRSSVDTIRRLDRVARSRGL